MFSSIRLKNFKAYRDSKSIPLRPLTVVLGANNSGKSSLLHSILLLAQTLDDTTSHQPLVTSGSYVDLGGYYDILWGGQHGGAQQFTIELVASHNYINRIYGPGTDTHISPTHLSLTFAFDAPRNIIVVSKCTIQGGNENFMDVRRSGRGYTAPLLSSKEREGFAINFRHFLPVFSPKKRTFGDISSKGREIYFRAEDAAFAWSQALGSVGHVAPLRQPVPRYGILGKSATSELGPGGENLLRVLRSNDEPLLSKGRLVDSVNEWISDRFGMLGSLRIVDVDESGTVLALLGDEKAGFDHINIANMGEGISQLLPIIARVLTTPPGGSLLVEQPELHLHPAAQADLADLFLNASAVDDRQYIVETHSEHLVLRIRRRIAEGLIDPAQVAILYVERPGRNSTIRSLDLDTLGQIDDWPVGFFEERYHEALAIAESGQRRATD